MPASSLTRRSALRLMTLSAGGALLAACGVAPQVAAPTAAPTPVAANPAPTAAAPTAVAATAGTPTLQHKTGGTLRFASTADVPNLDGHQRSSPSTDTVWTAYDRLIQYDANGKVQPMLAESWDVTPDYTQVKFNLRSGVQFHTGRELTSDDVKWNVLRARDPKVASGSYVTWSNWFTTIDTPDKNTIVLKSDASRPSMFDFFEWLNILDPVTMQGPDAQSRSVGTGPFVFQEWKQGDSLTFSKNANYWDTGKPYIDGFIVHILEAQSALVQLEAGAIDLVKTEAVDDIVRLKQDPNFQAVQHPFAGSFYEFGINITRPPYDDKRVRQAFNYAIDRQRYATSIMQSLVKPLALFWSSTSPAFDDARNASVPFDLDRSQSLLKEAGVSGLQADLLYIPASYPVLKPLAEMYQADLAKIGVTLNILSMDTATWLAQVNGVQYNGLYVSGDSLGNYQPATPLGASPAWSPSKNNSGFKTDEWTNLVNAVSTETDPAKQKQLYMQVNDYMIDQAWSIVFAERAVIWLTRSAVQNMIPTGRQSFLWNQVWIN
ncbi:MAG: ABC transporter substrate-binding protein [Chloroflexi bacterium]|nr:ABC transporter substrate-binding protein [Chloroflexota bacterium]